MTPRLLQLYSLRAQVDAIIAQEEAETLGIRVAEGCQHPEEKRRDATNMGEEPTFFCLECKQFVKGMA